MSLYVVLVEQETESQVVGAYLSAKLAKAGAVNYVETAVDRTFKKKQVKKDSEDTRHLLYLEDTKTSPVRVSVCHVPFEFPVSKTKKRKDPNAPKKGMSAFMIFSQENRSLIKEANPTATFAEIGKKVGESWSSLTDEQKVEFNVKSEADKVRYQKAHAEYTNTAEAPVAPAPVVATPVLVSDPVVKPKVKKVVKKVKVEA